MQSASQFTSELQQIDHSSLVFTAYDPTTCFLNDQVFDRDAFKQLKKAGLIEISHEHNGVKHYRLSTKGKKQIDIA